MQIIVNNIIKANSNFALILSVSLKWISKNNIPMYTIGTAIIPTTVNMVFLIKSKPVLILSNLNAPIFFTIITQFIILDNYFIERRFA